MAGNMPTISIRSPKIMMKMETNPMKKICQACPLVSLQLSSTASIGSWF